VRPSAFFDPRVAGQASARRVVAGVGARAIELARASAGALATLGGALRSVFAPGRAARDVVRRVVLMQILFTGVQALTLVSVIALFIGATIIIQVGNVAPATPGDLLAKILVAVVLREMAPLGTAIVIAGRSGTAIASELGGMKVGAEILALSSLGIDPPRYVVWPRLVGVIVSVLTLMVYFSVVAIVGGYLVSLPIFPSSFGALRAGFAETLGPPDLLLFLGKGVGLGTIVGWAACHFGLQVSVSPTEVPQMASRAVVTSLLACVVFNTAATAAFYWVVGSPMRN
jgi:phospholipid/cholesterol/gamma-HCH transport system permease protein